MSKSLLFEKRIVKYLPPEIRKRLPVEISVVPVSEKESAGLNRRYRKKDKAANVLSFRYGKEYGEILVCPAVIRREARMQRRSLDMHMTWMILHGMIHLAGVHHEESERMAKRVERLEQRILHKWENFNFKRPKT